VEGADPRLSEQSFIHFHRIAMQPTEPAGNTKISSRGKEVAAWRVPPFLPTNPIYVHSWFATHNFTVAVHPKTPKIALHAH